MAGPVLIIITVRSFAGPVIYVCGCDEGEQRVSGSVSGESSAEAAAGEQEPALRSVTSFDEGGDPVEQIQLVEVDIARGPLAHADSDGLACSVYSGYVDLPFLCPGAVSGGDLAPPAANRGDARLVPEDVLLADLFPCDGGVVVEGWQHGLLEIGGC